MRSSSERGGNGKAYRLGDPMADGDDDGAVGQRADAGLSPAKSTMRSRAARGSSLRRQAAWRDNRATSSGPALLADVPQRFTARCRTESFGPMRADRAGSADDDEAALAMMNDTQVRLDRVESGPPTSSRAERCRARGSTPARSTSIVAIISIHAAVDWCSRQRKRLDIVAVRVLSP